MSDEMEYGGAGGLARTVDVPKREAALEPGQVRTLRQLFDHARAKQIISPLLPKGVTYEEVYAETAHAVVRNPELLNCTPMSLIHAIGRAAQTGLIIGETVHLVPFKVNVGTKQNPAYESRCTKITDYKGEIELIKQCGGAKSINTGVVYASEIEGKHGGKFSLEQGSDPRIVHHPVLDPRHRGPMAGAYAVANISSVSPQKIVWMHVTEIDAIRKKNSQAWKGVDICPPWYAKKTAVHQIAKELPKTPKLLAVVRLLDDEEVEALPAGGPVALLEAPAA